MRRPRPRDPRPGARVGRQEDDARRRRQGRVRRRLPLRHRQRMGAHHDRPGRHAGPWQAGRQHLVHHAGRALRHRLLVPGLQRGRHLGGHQHPERRQAGRAPVARGRAGAQPAALHGGPDGLAPADPRGDARRAPRVARQGLLRLLHRVAVPEVRVPGAGIRAVPHVLQVRRLVHRHDDRDQPLRARLSRRQDAHFVVNQSIWLEGEARFADVILPACTNFERWDIGEWAAPPGPGRRPPMPATTASSSSRRSASSRSASRSPTTRSSRSSPSAWASATSTRRATPTSTGSGACSTPATCPRRDLLGGVRGEGLLPGAGPAGPRAHAGPALVRRGPRARHARPRPQAVGDGRAQRPPDRLGQDRVRGLEPRSASRSRAPWTPSAR